MGKYETLELLKQRIKHIKDEQQYIKEQHELALQRKDFAKALELNVRSISKIFKALLKEGEIKKIIKPDNKRKTYYIIKWKSKQP